MIEKCFSLVEAYRHLRAINCLHVQGRKKGVEAECIVPLGGIRHGRNWFSSRLYEMTPLSELCWSPRSEVRLVLLYLIIIGETALFWAIALEISVMLCPVFTFVYIATIIFYGAGLLALHLTPSLEDQLLVFMSPHEQGGSIKPPGTGIPFHRLLRLTGLRWGCCNFSYLPLIRSINLPNYFALTCAKQVLSVSHPRSLLRLGSS